jgi:hypothetical protein
MKRILATLAVLAVLGLTALPVAAACTTHTILVDGRMTVCTTCCFGHSCTTTCF